MPIRRPLIALAAAVLTVGVARAAHRLRRPRRDPPSPARATYIVTRGTRHARGHGDRPLAPPRWRRCGHVYPAALNGFSVTLPAPAAAAARRAARRRGRGAGRLGARADGQAGRSPPWGLDRIDQRDLPLYETYTYTRTGRASRRTSSTPASVDPHRVRGTGDVGLRRLDGGTADDCNGHGTHVAARRRHHLRRGQGRTWCRTGPQLLGQRTNAQVIAGIDWVTANPSRIRRWPT